MNPTEIDTTAWRFQVWASFVIAVAATAIGIIYLPVPAWVRGYVGIGMLFTVGSSFTLAKTVRDEQEAKRRPRGGEPGLRDIDDGGAQPYRKAA